MATESVRENEKPVLVINAGGVSRRMGRTKALLPVPPDNRPLFVHIAQRLSTLAEPRIVVVANDPEITQNTYVEEQIEFMPDRHPGTGALGGIATALTTAQEWIILVACDMPLVNPDLFEMLCALATENINTGDTNTGDTNTGGTNTGSTNTGSTNTGSTNTGGTNTGGTNTGFIKTQDVNQSYIEEWDAVVPIVGGHAQTMHALYHRRCLPVIEARLAADDLKVANFLSDVRARWVNEAEVAQFDPTFRSFINTNTPDEWRQALTLLQETEN